MLQQGEPDSAYIVNPVTKDFKLLGKYNKKTMNETDTDFTWFYFSIFYLYENSWAPCS